MLTFQLLTLLFAWVSSSSATYIKSTMGQGIGAAEYWTCNTGVSGFTFDYTPLMLGSYSSIYDGICGYPPAIGTILICSVELADDKSEAFRKKIFEYASTACNKYSSYLEDWTFYQAQYLNATKYYKPFEDITNVSLPLYYPSTPNITALGPEYIGYKAYYFNLDSGTWFSVGICGYFLLLIVISTIFNFARYAGVTKSINNSSFAKLCQKYVIFPTMFPNGKFSQFWGSKWFPVYLPNRIQFITDVFLFGLQIAFYCVSYRYKEGWWFGTPEHAWQRYVADRTGIMAFGKIPLLVLFAGRNNFLLWITGWSYSTFLHFHKVVAWWMSLDTLIHSVAYTINSLGYYVLYIKTEPYFVYGIIATIFCGLILLFALPPFRVFYYEYFLVVHVSFAVIFVAMCWWHCNTLGWLEWLIATCCVWAFDRILRVIRMFAFGYRTATLTVVGDQLIKVEVPKPTWWRHQPGTYSYIYFAGIIFWENHPFTIVVEGNNLCAYIRVKKGVTYRMWNKLLKNNNTMTWKVSVEGPYGGQVATPLKKYDEALLIAGGSGVPGILENATQVSSGKLIWISQTLQGIKAYHNLLKNVNIDVEVYITREQGESRVTSIEQFLNETESTDLSTDNSEKESTELKALSNSKGNFKIFYVRPNIEELIDSNIRDSPSSSIGIAACGPPVLMDSIRHTLASHVTKWDKSVDYFDEFQIW